MEPCCKRPGVISTVSLAGSTVNSSTMFYACIELSPSFCGTRHSLFSKGRQSRWLVQSQQALCPKELAVEAVDPAGSDLTGSGGAIGGVGSDRHVNSARSLNRDSPSKVVCACLVHKASANLQSWGGHPNVAGHRSR